VNELIGAWQLSANQRHRIPGIDGGGCRFLSGTERGCLRCGKLSIMTLERYVQ